jgi:hypothetical protein
LLKVSLILIVFGSVFHGDFGRTRWPGQLLVAGRMVGRIAVDFDWWIHFYIQSVL